MHRHNPAGHGLALKYDEGVDFRGVGPAPSDQESPVLLIRSLDEDRQRAPDLAFGKAVEDLPLQLQDQLGAPGCLLRVTVLHLRSRRPVLS